MAGTHRWHSCRSSDVFAIERQMRYMLARIVAFAALDSMMYWLVSVLCCSSF